jgi:hypothetical protein
MRQLAYLGLAALSAVALFGVGCGGDDDKTNAAGGATATQGGSFSGGGKSSTSSGASAGQTASTTAAGGTLGTAGNTGIANTAGRTSTAPGNTAGNAGAGEVAVTLTPGENLLNDKCEVGGGPEVMGVIGGFYLFGDQNAEHPNGQSCTLPPSGTKVCKKPEGATSPAVCLSGTTVKDSTYAAWGCGMGLSLHSSDTVSTGDSGAAGAAGAPGVLAAAGAPGTAGAAGAPGSAGAPGAAGAFGSAGAPSTSGASEKLTYSGPATCFELTFTGSTGGINLRVGFTQYADPSIKTQSVAPFKTVRAFTNGWTGKVCFADVTCPNWSSAPGQGCPADLVATPSKSFDLQIQVPGGDGANTYDFCLTKIVPLKPSAS